MNRLTGSAFGYLLPLPGESIRYGVRSMDAELPMSNFWSFASSILTVAQAFRLTILGER